MINYARLSEFVANTYNLKAEERDNRVYGWISDPTVRESIEKNATFLIEEALKRAMPDAVNRALASIRVRVDFAQTAFGLHAQNPALSQQAGLTPHDVLHAFRILLKDGDFHLDENGILELDFSMVDKEEVDTEPPPPPEPEVIVEVTEEGKAVVNRSVKDICAEVNRGLHDHRLPELVAAENLRPEPRSSVINTVKTRLAYVKTTEK